MLSPPCVLIKFNDRWYEEAMGLHYRRTSTHIGVVQHLSDHSDDEPYYLACIRTGTGRWDGHRKFRELPAAEAYIDALMALEDT